MDIRSSILHRFWNHIFPISKAESYKFILLSTLCCILCMNYTILRNVKDTLIITTPEMGIYVIPFLRTWMLMPLMLVFVKAYAMLSTRFSQSKVSYIFITLFLSYFVLFIYFLYPNEQFYRPNAMANWMDNTHSILVPFSKILRYWSFSIYYCIAEVWGAVVILILFWGMSNRSSSLEQAKRFYSPIILIANISGIFASQVSIGISQGDLKSFLFPDLDKWGATLCALTLFVAFTTAIALGMFYLLYRSTTMNQEQQNQKKVTKEEMSLTQMVICISKNVKFWPLAMMVGAYFFCTGVMEFMWKFYLQKLYPNANQFNDFLNQTTIYISIFSVLLSLFVTGTLIRRFSWKVCAIITPLLLIIPVFFSLMNYFFAESQEQFLMIAVYLGAVYYSLNRICKFSFFDLSKEVACVEFSYDEQIKAKAVLDGILPKISKTSESVFMQVFLLFSIGIEALMPIILGIMLLIHLSWAYLIPSKRTKKTAEAI